MNLRTKIVALSTLPLLLPVLIGINRSSAQNPKQTKRVGLTVLQSSEALTESDRSKRSVLAHVKDIAVSSDAVDVLTSDGTYSFKLRKP